MIINLRNQKIRFLKPNQNHLINRLWKTYKYLLLVILLLMVGLAILTGFFIERTYRFNRLTNVLKEFNTEKSKINTRFCL
jgi:hypothetical protein